MDPVKDFVSNLLKEAKLDTLPEDLRTNIENQLLVQTYKRIGTVIMNELNNEQAAEYAKLIENPQQVNEQAVNEFLTKHTQKMDQKIQAALVDLAATFLTNLKKA